MRTKMTTGLATFFVAFAASSLTACDDVCCVGNEAYSCPSNEVCETVEREGCVRDADNDSVCGG